MLRSGALGGLFPNGVQSLKFIGEAFGGLCGFLGSREVAVAKAVHHFGQVSGQSCFLHQIEILEEVPVVWGRLD